MYATKYEHIRIPVLKKFEYTTWKVKMLMFMEATDPDFLDRTMMVHMSLKSLFQQQ